MKPHPRIRKTVKWGGAVVTALLVVMWLASGHWRVEWGGGAPRERLLGIEHGGVSVRLFCLGNTPRTLDVLEDAGYHLQWLPELRAPFAGGVYWVTVFVALWIPAAATGCATIFAWRLDIAARRRARLKFCLKCHYDRTGLAAGAVCPECGAGAMSATD